MPIPTFPFESMTNAVEVALVDVVVEMRKSGVVPAAEPAIENLDAGVEVEPTPTVPSALTLKSVVDALDAISKSWREVVVPKMEMSA